MDKLVLKGLKFRGLHGFFDEERVEGNDFEVDVIFVISLEESAKKDDISKTIDYSKAQEIIASVIYGESKKLIETLTFLIGQKLYSFFPDVESLEVKVRKMNPPMPGETEYSEVTMSWPR
ncbi:MAG: dihydroneopterin aldolase [Balneolaceae bacterium]|nr:dihydroneopterin aldolase [Balneolaceae bacterium]MBO6545913.1 dihydroneopterin aldolase [Balneolaceae bacterium]MBO6647309.1 dihydroneopterin aldolase [Balneolaceae bacterium]